MMTKSVQPVVAAPLVAPGAPVPGLPRVSEPPPAGLVPVAVVPQSALFRVGFPGVGQAAAVAAHVAAARDLLATVATAAESVGLRNFPRYAAHPHQFWGALLLRNLGVPQGMVERQCLEWRPRTGSYGLWYFYNRLLASDEVRFALARIGAMGLTHFLQRVNLLSDVNAAELGRAERALEGVRVVKEIRAEGLRGALASEEALVGVEVEAFPGRTIPHLLHPLPPTDSRDTVYRAMADHYRAAGYPVRLLNGAARFTFPKQPTVLPSLREVFRHEGRTILLYRLHGTSGIQHRVDDFADFPTGTPAISWMPETDTPVALLSREEEEAAYTFAATQLGLPSADAVRALRAQGGDAYESRPMVMVKSTDGDIAYFQLVLRNDGKAEIRPMNGRFNGATPEAQKSRVVPARDLTEALAQLESLLRSTPVRKTNAITGLVVQGYGTVAFQDEEWPYNELISPPTRPRDIGKLMPAWQTLADRWHVGTTPYTGVSQHVHMGVPLKVNGRFSLAPLLSVYRGYLQIEAALHGLMPVHKTRKGFITEAPPELRALLQDPEACSDPTDPRQILCFLAELAHRTPTKYTALNWDKYVGALLGAMLDEGVFIDGETIEAHWRGQTYRFRVTHQPAEERYQIVWERKDEKGKDAPVALIRASKYTWQPTGELRIFDAVHENRKPGRHRLDVASLRYITEFAAAFGWLHAYAPFVT